MSDDDKRKRKRRREGTQFCPFCDYTCQRASVMARHINRSHEGKKSGEKHALMNILEKSKSIPAMLHATADFLASGDIFDGTVPKEVMEELRKEDVKVQIALRIIAIAKIQRVFGLSKIQDRVDKELRAKLNKKDWKEKETPVSLVELSRKVQNQISSEIEVLQDMSSITNISIADVIDKLGAIFTPLVGKGDMAFGIHGSFVSPDAGRREKIRSVVAGLTVGELDAERGGGNEEPGPKGDGDGSGDIGGD